MLMVFVMVMVTVMATTAIGMVLMSVMMTAMIGMVMRRRSDRMGSTYSYQ